MSAIIDNKAEPTRSRRNTQRWLGACAIAVAVAILVWTAWPAGGAAGMTAEDFKQMYEGGSCVDAACPPVFP